MLKYFCLLLFPICSVSAQSEIIFNFPSSKSISDKENYVQLYEYKSPEISIFKKRYRIDIPDSLRNDKTAFGFINFGGSKYDGLGGNTLIAIHNYQFGKPSVYIDYNHNLSLRDDPKPLIFSNLRDTLEFSLSNTDKAGVSVHYKLFYPQYATPQAAKQTETILGKTGVGRDNKVLPIQYWLCNLAQNNIVTDTSLDEQNIRIGLHDANKNGLYNDPDDRIMIGDYLSKKISPSLSDGAVSYAPECVIRLQNKSYTVVEVEPTGKYIRLKPTEQDALRMFEGETVIDFPFKRVDAPTTTLYEQLDAEKYTVLYFWGLWCKDNPSYTQKLASLCTRFPNKIQVIGMNVGDHPDNIRKQFRNMHLNWVNGIATKDVLSIFLTDTYPTCVLISPDKKILRFNANIEEIDAYIRR